MSFSRLNYDSCAYNKSMSESVAIGNYMLQQPQNNCNETFFASPYIRLDKSQVSTCSNRPVIDVDSELIGLKRTASKCTKSDFPNCKMNHLKTTDRSHFMSPEDTKISNPPCTLRGTGWNRWEWLCENPQKYAEIPFVTMISDKTLAKDNHRPLLPNLIDKTNVLTDDLSCMMESKQLSGEETPFVHWRSCAEIKKY